MSNKRAKQATYWMTTVALSATVVVAGLTCVTHRPSTEQEFQRLGYPLYLMSLLGVSAILGACILVLPRWTLVKEWAYAGFVYAFIGALSSHIATGDSKGVTAAASVLVLLVISYLTRPSNRRLAFWSPGY